MVLEKTVSGVLSRRCAPYGPSVVTAGDGPKLKALVVPRLGKEKYVRTLLLAVGAFFVVLGGATRADAAHAEESADPELHALRWAVTAVATLVRYYAARWTGGLVARCCPRRTRGPGVPITPAQRRAAGTVLAAAGAWIIFVVSALG